MEAPQHRLTMWRTTAYAVWAIIGIGVVAYAAALGIGRIAGALAPFVVAFLFVFLLQGTVNRLVTRGVRRPVAVAICFLVASLAITVIGIFLVPALARQILQFVSAVPSYFEQAEQAVRELQARYSELVIPQWLRTTALAVLGSLTTVFVRTGDVLARGILSAGGSIATIFFDLFLGAVIAFWTLKDLPKIRQELRALVGERYEVDLENLLETTTHVVGGYLKGQTIVSLVTGALTGLGLAVLGVPYALVLGIIAFVLNYIPYIGPLVSGLIAAAAALFIAGPVKALLAVAVAIAAQQVADLLVTPRVMSESVDLHPTLVVFSLLVGGSLFGFWGMILAIPVAATAKGLFVYYYERRTQRRLATEDGALFRTPSGDDEAVYDEPTEPEDPAEKE